ncbi:MAG: flippase-like domain-containing protein [Lachnospiraceae bacterium]|jgi:uncharacterized protein (TIRG00374 family)|nr:flippase-like domain-containing protein [Lachnospiraceae bacterium]
MKKKVLNAVFFFLVMGLTFYTVLRNNDLTQMSLAFRGAKVIWLIPAVACALFFVASEGCMIWDLLRLLGHRNSLLRCISYSFIGYFYSGITPSSSGGQPMQLYYMKKDGNSMADSSVILMTLAFFSRLILSVVGILLLLFCSGLLHTYFQGYIYIYYLGLTLNTLTALFIFGAMAAPGVLHRIIKAVESFLVRIHLMKPSSGRIESIDGFIDGYRSAVSFLVGHKGRVAYLFFFSFIQRISLYILTWFVCMGFGMKDPGFLKISLLQAAIYVAVEMLPLPGAQGITELLYHNVFGTLLGTFLGPTMLVVRGIDFYMLMLLGMLAVLLRLVQRKYATVRIS